MTLLIRNATIVTGDEADTIHYRAAIAISGNRIAAIGPDAELAQALSPSRDDRCHGTRDLPRLRQYPHPSGDDAGPWRLRGSLAAARASLLWRPLAPSPCLPSPPAEQAAMWSARRVGGHPLRDPPALIEDAVNIENYADDMVGTGLRLVLAERAWDRVGGSIGDPSEFRRDAALGAAGVKRIERLQRTLERRWRGPRARGRLGLGAGHVLARVAARASVAAGSAGHHRHDPSQPDLGRGRCRTGASQHAAEPVPGRASASSMTGWSPRIAAA